MPTIEKKCLSCAELILGEAEMCSLCSEFSLLRSRIAEENDLPIFDEAVRCYRAQAWRMAYIASWIAVAESLKFKFKSMSERDQAASAVLKEVVQQEEQHRPSDKLLLDKAKDFGILNDISYMKMEFLLRMRNVFAHPYNIQPTVKEVVQALNAAVEEVLSQQPFLRKAYIASLLESLKNDQHFVDDYEESVNSAIRNIVPRIAPSLHPYLFKELLYAGHQVGNDASKELFLRRIVWSTREYIRVIKPDFEDPIWQLDQKTTDFTKMVAALFGTPDLWRMIPLTIQDRIFSYLLCPETENGFKMRRWIARLVNGEVLSARQKERFMAFVADATLQELASVGVPLKFFINRIINDLKSYTWATQNQAASVLGKMGVVALETLTVQEQEVLGRNILQSAEGGAWESKSFLNNIVSSSEKCSEAFVKGLLFECYLNEAGFFRCKGALNKSPLVKTILHIVVMKNKGSVEVLFDRLIGGIKGAQIKNDDNFYAVQGIDESIGQLKVFVDSLQGSAEWQYSEKILLLANTVLDKKGSG